MTALAQSRRGAPASRLTPSEIVGGLPMGIDPDAPGLPDGGSEVSLAEETTLLEGPGDEFSVRLVNDRNQGFELVWVKGEEFVKSLYGAFHKRRTDRTDPPRIREQAMSRLATFDRLARGLKLRNAGESKSEGRRVVRYVVTGYGARAGEKDTSDLPPVQYPENRTDPDTARRLELWEKEEPLSVRGNEGEILRQSVVEIAGESTALR